MKRLMALMIIVLPLMASADEEIIGYLGISGQGLSEAMKTALGLEYGVLVERVYEGSPAEKTEIKIGDVILKIDDQKITDFEVMKDIVQKNPDKQIKIDLSRVGKKISKKLTLEQKEAKRLKIDIPDIEELKHMVGCGAVEIQKQIDALKEKVDELKKEIDEIKKEKG